MGVSLVYKQSHFQRLTFITGALNELCFDTAVFTLNESCVTEAINHILYYAIKWFLICCNKDRIVL